jgi:putative copper resistance protein D
MDWLGDGMNGPLMIVRAVHFAATAITTGALIFRAAVTEPIVRSARVAAPVVRTQIPRVAWIGLAIATASGALWVFVEAAAMSGLSFKETMTYDVLSVVVNETQFGVVSEIRLALALILAVCLTYDRYSSLRWLGLASALGLVAAIAWTGHAAASVGEIGILHVTADALHLIAAAAWLGGLVSLALLLAAARHHQDVAWASVEYDATRRFSTLGLASVGAISITGIINTWILVGSVRALITTDYGRLLMLKLTLFAAMLAIAAANRCFVTPRLAVRYGIAAGVVALRQLTRNSMVEIALALTIFGIVAVLGTLHPAIHVSR